MSAGKKDDLLDYYETKKYILYYFDFCDFNILPEIVINKKK